ncbi:T9SS C-terminal target domain-containing protein [Flagellimonas taeanensis]|nr:T9SS C-terminal target domain-containing protein [Allomuricauda taeanensis]
MHMKPYPFSPSALFFTLVLTLLSGRVLAQQPGQAYFDNTGFVEYIHGNHPIIISVPHDGDMNPNIIPDRNCMGCITGNDTHTQSMGRAIAQAYFNETGFYPYVIINRLSRAKFDANREKPEAANGNPTVELAFDNYHGYIESAKVDIIQNFGRGLFLDLHGHAHAIERVELGYTLTGDELRLSDATLNTNAYINKNSIRTLINDNQGGLKHVELLKGPYSFGTLLHEKGYPTVPSSVDPYPNPNEDYYNGGYNVWIHGSRLNAGEIDGIQIEVNQDVRFDPADRALFVDALTLTLTQYLSLHYDIGVIDFDQDGFTSEQDCNDYDPNINPSSIEIPYNGIDEDCNPATLDDDLDQDGFDNADDCNDNDPNINPVAAEIPYNGIDDDCDPATLDDDFDQDGFANADDCDDNDPNMNPTVVEIPYNGIDDDCNPATLDDDLDQDGFVNADDCDDNDPNINPNAAEIPYNGIDDDCNPATLDDDLDQDGFVNMDDCNDNDPNINPSVVEIPYNGIDEDCDSATLDDDLDQDGFNNADDCDDNDPNINPTVVEIPYNGVDDDCNPATLDDDLDQDGFNNADDCDDNDPNINPTVVEIPYNGVDDDCDPLTLDDDLDQDGFDNADDCDDNDPSINPSADEIPDNEVDENCDGLLETTPEPEPEPEIKNGVIIYPNPARNQIFIKKDNASDFVVQIFDANGRLVLRVTNQTTLKIDHLSSGTYLLIYTDPSSMQVIRKKMIVLR